MQNYKCPNSFIRHTIKYVYILALIALTQNIFPQQNNIYSEAQVIIDADIIKSTQVTVKFDVQAFNITQSKTTASYKELLPGYETLDLFFKTLEKKYGKFSFEKVIPTANWGDTLFHDEKTGEVRKLIDMSQLYHIKFNHFINIDSIISALEQLKFVVYAHRPIQAVNLYDPNDLCYSNLGNCIPGITGNQWNLFKIDAPKAWDITKGLQEIKIAEIDAGSVKQGGGPNKSHPDFQLPDGSSKFADGGDPTIGGTDHATEVCGIIGAATNNNTGIASLGWNVKILPYWFYSGDSVGVASKINTARVQGSKVINLSFITVKLDRRIGKCDIYSSVSIPSVVNAIDNAITANVIVVAGVGNRGYELIQGLCFEPEDYEIFPYIPYPAATPGVIGVSATDINDHFPDDLNYNHEFNSTSFIDISAPGIDVISTSFNSYDIIRGTSFSAPHVAALVGLIKSINESITPAPR